MTEDERIDQITLANFGCLPYYRYLELKRQGKDILAYIARLKEPKMTVYATTDNLELIRLATLIQEVAEKQPAWSNTHARTLVMALRDALLLQATAISLREENEKLKQYIKQAGAIHT